MTSYHLRNRLRAWARQTDRRLEHISGWDFLRVATALHGIFLIREAYASCVAFPEGIWATHSFSTALWLSVLRDFVIRPILRGVARVHQPLEKRLQLRAPRRLAYSATVGEGKQRHQNFDGLSPCGISPLHCSELRSPQVLPRSVPNLLYESAIPIPRSSSTNEQPLALMDCRIRIAQTRKRKRDTPSEKS